MDVGDRCSRVRWVAPATSPLDRGTRFPRTRPWPIACKITRAGARRINENDHGSGTGLQRIGGELSGDDHQEGHRRAGYPAAWLRAVQADDRRVRSAEPCSSTRAPVHPRSCAGASMSCPRCRQYPRTFLRMTRRVCRMVVLATQWPATRVRPGPHPKRTRVVIPSAC